jgi:cytochrome c oxidase subunit 2
MDRPVHLTNIFDPVSTPAQAIVDLSWLVLWICAGIFVIVVGLLTYILLRFRRRRLDTEEPPQVYGSNQIELAWTVLPVLTVVVLFLVTTRTIRAVQNVVPSPDALQVTIVGHQWWWEIRYPALGIVTANEVHVPVSDRARPQSTFLRLASVDVVHSFWVPRLAGKTDVIPNRANQMWIEPFETGTYIGQCAEYCGTQHANMLLRVMVHTQEDFARWVAAQQQPPVRALSVQAGRDLFQAIACVNCHTVRETLANGTFGPDLSHLMSRATLGAGVVDNTLPNLRAWMQNPQHLKPGNLMPDMKLTPPELEHIVAYLATLK